MMCTFIFVNDVMLLYNESNMTLCFVEFAKWRCCCPHLPAYWRLAVVVHSFLVDHSTIWQPGFIVSG